jgi:hypothetical protein
VRWLHRGLPASPANDDHAATHDAIALAAANIGTDAVANARTDSVANASTDSSATNIACGDTHSSIFFDIGIASVINDHAIQRRSDPPTVANAGISAYARPRAIAIDIGTIANTCRDIPRHHDVKYLLHPNTDALVVAFPRQSGNYRTNRGNTTG